MTTQDDNDDVSFPPWFKIAAPIALVVVVVILAVLGVKTALVTAFWLAWQGSVISRWTRWPARLASSKSDFEQSALL